MENELRTFENGEFGKLETIEIEGKPYFPAIKCAEMLGYANPYDAINKHCKPERGAIREALTKGGIQQVKYISEGNLYRLIVSSKLPSAERFESWVFDEVLPTIRLTGSYHNDSPFWTNPAYQITNPALRARKWAIECEYTEQLEIDKARLTIRNDERESLMTIAKFCDQFDLPLTHLERLQLGRILYQNGLTKGKARHGYSRNDGVYSVQQLWAAVDEMTRSYPALFPAEA